jgi:hypothetical protein
LEKFRIPPTLPTLSAGAIWKMAAGRKLGLYEILLSVKGY